MSERILTIGMAVHKDFKGVWHTVQSIIEENFDLRDKFEFVILDNSPNCEFGEKTRNWARGFHNTACPVNYVSCGPRQSTSLRNLVFHAADTEYVMCVDSHIILKRDSIRKLIAFLESGAAGNDLYQGPLYNEQGVMIGTHMNPAFRGGNFGTWGVMKYEDGENFSDPGAQPFEIPSQGMGLWLTRRDTWLGYPISFNHFSGEEGYIQELYRAAGRKAWCLPFLGWVHCFGHVGGTTYKNTNYDKMRNHLIAFRHLGISDEYPDEYYSAIIGKDEAARCRADVDTLDIQKVNRHPDAGEPFLGFPLRINDHSRKEPQDYQVVERRIPVSERQPA